MKLVVGKTEETKYASVMDMIQDRFDHSYSFCGGQGSCGKCKVIVEKKNDQPLTSSEIEHLTEKEIQKQIRLACRIKPVSGMMIDCDLFLDNQDYSIESDFQINWESGDNQTETSGEGDEGYRIAVDVGTTTLVAALIDRKAKKVVGIEKALNSQARYGADIISRIHKSQEVGVEKLESLLKKDIFQCIEKLLHQHSADLNCVDRIAMAGNTTMLHFLMGLNPLPLAVSPFTPATTEKCVFLLRDFFQLFSDISFAEHTKVEILPALSAYIGADILAGIHNSRMHEKESMNMLLDIGTNGELVLGNRHRMLCTSTAAGPAFEGGNITHGMGSIEGAVFKVEILGKKVKAYTIHHQKPQGLCGTGIIDTIAEMLKEDLLTAEGRMSSSLEGRIMIDEENGIAVYQKDIQEIQLAKAAIRAGIEILLKGWGIAYKDLDKVYLAGGFGSHADIKNMIKIGLLPKEFEKKTKVIGNSSLGGTIEYLMNPGQDFEKIKAVCSYVDLANESTFYDLFIQNMDF